MPKMNDTSEDNHQLLLLVSGKVDSLATTLADSVKNNAAEFDKLWRHQEERDLRQTAALQLTADKLAASIAAVSERQNNSGKPNIQAIVAVLVLIGAIAVAFIAPLKADIMRTESDRKELAAAVLVKEETIQSLEIKQAIDENDLKWVMGYKRMDSPQKKNE